MAEYQSIPKLEENLLFYCDNHAGFPAETVSTNKYHWMCHGHSPIYLFRKIKEEEMVKLHRGVSFKKLKFLKNYHFHVK